MTENKRNIFKIRIIRNGALTWSGERVPAIMSQPALCLCLIKKSYIYLYMYWYPITSGRVAVVTYSLQSSNCTNNHYLLNCSLQNIFNPKFDSLEEPVNNQRKIQTPQYYIHTIWSDFTIYSLEILTNVLFVLFCC